MPNFVGAVVFLAWGMLGPAPAWAGGGVSGSGVPSTGGGFAGSSEPGARGVFFNPAAVNAGEAPELLVDVGMLGLGLRTDLEDFSAPSDTFGIAPQPSAAIAIPIGKLGLGASVHGPVLRAGEDDPDGEYRFLSISSELLLVQGNVSAAYALHDRVTVGAGLRVGYSRYRSDYAIDSAVLLNEALELTGDELELPVGEPFLEGQQRVGRLLGTGLSWMAGARVRLPADIELHAAFEPRWRIAVDGPVELEPSLDLNTQVEGQGRVELVYPMRLFVAGRVPIGKFTVIPEFEYIGWGSADEFLVDLAGLQIASSDPAFDTLFYNLGLTEAGFLTAAEGQSVEDLSWQDVLLPSVQVEWQARPDVAVRAGLGYGPSAVPDSIVSPANVDFATWTLKLAGAWQPLPQLRVSGTGEYFYSPLRTITGSVSTDPSLPSGNGTYKLTLWRLGVTAQFFLAFQRSREEA